jgi:uncharacterized protein (TIGR04141 family)
LTGAVKEKYRDIFKNVTGANSLKVHSKIKATEIPDLCKTLLSIYSTKRTINLYFSDLILQIMSTTTVSFYDKVARCNREGLFC